MGYNLIPYDHLRVETGRVELSFGLWVKPSTETHHSQWIMDAASGHAWWCPIIKYKVYGMYIMIIHDISILNGPFRPTFNWGAPSPVEVALWFDYSKYIFLLIVLREDLNQKPWFFTTYCRGFRFRFSLNQSIDSVYSVNLVKNQPFIDENRWFSHENFHVPFAYLT